MARHVPPAPGRPYVLIEAEGAEAILALDPESIAEYYRRHGALLLRGFGTDAATFAAFTAQFCSTSVVNESPGRTPISADAQIYTVNAGGEAFALHPELSREPWKPDVAFFACLKAPAGDGATTICDGIELVRALPEPVRRGLSGKRLFYAAQAWPSVLEYWLGTATPHDALLGHPPASCPYRFTRDRHGQIARYFKRPALHKPMFADDPAFGNFLLFARFNLGRGDFPLLDDLSPVPEEWLQAARAAGDALSARVDWRNGDVLMLDNTRFMHGRTAINAPGERLIATRFGYLRFAVPDADEPPDPVWRREDFVPPLSPRHPGLAGTG